MREFVRTHVVLTPRRAWKGGSEQRVMPPLPGDPGDPRDPREPRINLNFLHLFTAKVTRVTLLNKKTCVQVWGPEQKRFFCLGPMFFLFRTSSAGGISPLRGGVWPPREPDW